VALLSPVVVGIDLRAELDLFDLDANLLLSRFLLPDVALVLELAVVYDPANRWTGLRSDFDEVQIKIPGPAESIICSDDAYLISIGANQANLGGPDPPVDTRVNGYPASPPSENKAPTSCRRRGITANHQGGSICAWGTECQGGPLQGTPGHHSWSSSSRPYSSLSRKVSSSVV